MKKIILLIVLLPILFLACNSDGSSSTETQPEKTDTTSTTDTQTVTTEKYHVTYVSQYGTAPVDTNEYAEGDTATIKGMEYKGCSNDSTSIVTFNKWIFNGTGYNANDSFTINGNTTFTADFNINTCAARHICQVSEGCAACVANPETYNVVYKIGNQIINSTEHSAGETIIIDALPSSKCEGNTLVEFRTWTFNGQEYRPGSSFTITEDTTFITENVMVNCEESGGICVLNNNNCAECASQQPSD